MIVNENIETYFGLLIFKSNDLFFTLIKWFVTLIKRIAIKLNPCSTLAQEETIIIGYAFLIYSNTKCYKCLKAKIFCLFESKIILLVDEMKFLQLID